MSQSAPSVRRLFGTDGVRGIANTELSPALALALGAAAARVLRESCENFEIVVLHVRHALPWLRHGGRQVDAPGLEERDGVDVASKVALGDIKQRAEHGRPHHRLILGEWVGENDAVGARIVCRNAQPPRLARVGEAPADDLVEAKVPHRVLRAPPQPLLATEPADPVRH